jgi:ketosteroid isomerase-like protein
MILPDALKRFFEAEQSGDAGALSSAFSDDAVVKDEGATHRGLAQVRRWWLDAKQKYSHTAQPISVENDGDATCVLAMVSGNFPNSPAQLHFRFVLEAGKISELEIGG